MPMQSKCTVANPLTQTGSPYLSQTREKRVGGNEINILKEKLRLVVRFGSQHVFLLVTMDA